MLCYEAYKKYSVPCDKKTCPFFIHSNDNLNCTILASNDSKTFAEMASILSISKMRVYQIYLKSIKKINAFVKQKDK